MHQQPHGLRQRPMPRARRKRRGSVGCPEANLKAGRKLGKEDIICTLLLYLVVMQLNDVQPARRRFYVNVNPIAGH
jgi:hypothetical protein